ERHTEWPLYRGLLPAQNEQRASGEQEKEPEHRGGASDQLVNVLGLGLHVQVELQTYHARHFAQCLPPVEGKLNDRDQDDAEHGLGEKGTVCVIRILFAGEPGEQLVVPPERAVQSHAREQQSVDRSERREHDQRTDDLPAGGPEWELKNVGGDRLGLAHAVVADCAEVREEVTRGKGGGAEEGGRALFFLGFLCPRTKERAPVPPAVSIKDQHHREREG